MKNPFPEIIRLIDHYKRTLSSKQLDELEKYLKGVITRRMIKAPTFALELGNIIGYYKIGGKPEQPNVKDIESAYVYYKTWNYKPDDIPNADIAFMKDLANMPKNTLKSFSDHANMEEQAKTAKAAVKQATLAFEIIAKPVKNWHAYVYLIERSSKLTDFLPNILKRLADKDTYPFCFEYNRQPFVIITEFIEVMRALVNHVPECTEHVRAMMKKISEDYIEGLQLCEHVPRNENPVLIDHVYRPFTIQREDGSFINYDDSTVKKVDEDYSIPVKIGNKSITIVYMLKYNTFLILKGGGIELTRSIDHLQTFTVEGNTFTFIEKYPFHIPSRVFSSVGGGPAFDSEIKEYNTFARLINVDDFPKNIKTIYINYLGDNDGVSRNTSYRLNIVKEVTPKTNTQTKKENTPDQKKDDSDNAQTKKPKKNSKSSKGSKGSAQTSSNGTRRKSATTTRSMTTRSMTRAK